MDTLISELKLFIFSEIKSITCYVQCDNFKNKDLSNFSMTTNNMKRIIWSLLNRDSNALTFPEFPPITFTSISLASLFTPVCERP